MKSQEPASAVVVDVNVLVHDPDFVQIVRKEIEARLEQFCPTPPNFWSEGWLSFVFVSILSAIGVAMGTKNIFYAMLVLAAAAAGMIWYYFFRFRTRSGQEEIIMFWKAYRSENIMGRFEMFCAIFGTNLGLIKPLDWDSLVFFGAKLNLLVGNNKNREHQKMHGDFLQAVKRIEAHLDEIGETRRTVEWLLWQAACENHEDERKNVYKVLAQMLNRLYYLGMKWNVFRYELQRRSVLEQPLMQGVSLLSILSNDHLIQPEFAQ